MPVMSKSDWDMPRYKRPSTRMCILTMKIWARNGEPTSRKGNMEKIIPLRTPLSTQLTPTQQRIWKVLQQDSNRELSIRKICALAGYRTVTPWYDAIQDTAFRAMIEALGIVIDRQHLLLSQRVALSIEDAEAEWQKDVIDIRRLMSDYPK